MAKPILVSGIQPTGKLHIGNYLGALKHFVELQNSELYECFFFVADLHSLSENFDPKEKNKQILELAADYLAAGLDPKKSVIFHQSQIPAHSEAAEILGALMPIGELRRMTQFKEKSEIQKENVNLGLLTYPVLMATDVLLYNAKFVPVGNDQMQHLELTRTLARRFNNRFGKTFVEPKPLLTNAPRVMSLDDPKKKMAKSSPKGCLFIDDSPADVRAKAKRAVTDSGSEIKYDPAKKPAVSNLLTIYSSLTGESIKKVEPRFAKKGYAEFKSAFAEVIVNHFAEFRAKKKSLLAKPATLKQILRHGSGQASKVAARKIAEIKKKVGIAL